ncbi:MAG TPA: hypothetical protein VE521_06835 [Nitrososphaera sp.]|nr:hypothetical protein [Nitrososphaera sp.]
MILAISLRKEATTTAIDTARNKTPKAFLISTVDLCNSDDAVASNLNHHHNHHHHDCAQLVM